MLVLKAIMRVLMICDVTPQSLMTSERKTMMSWLVLILKLSGGHAIPDMLYTFWLPIYLSTSLYIYLYICMCMYMYVYIHTRKYMCVCVCILCVCRYRYIYEYTHICMSTYMQLLLIWYCWNMVTIFILWGCAPSKS